MFSLNVKHIQRSHTMKNKFSLVSTYINWSSLSLPTLRMRKVKESYMVSAAHPLIKWCSNRLFRLSSFCYITKGEIFIGRPPVRDDMRFLRGGVHPQGEVQCVQR